MQKNYRNFPNFLFFGLQAVFLFNINRNREIWREQSGHRLVRNEFMVSQGHSISPSKKRDLDAQEIFAIFWKYFVFFNLRTFFATKTCSDTKMSSKVSKRVSWGVFCTVQFWFWVIMAGLSASRRRGHPDKGPQICLFLFFFSTFFLLSAQSRLFRSSMCFLTS